MRTIDPMTCEARPWANGGGTSRDLATGPATVDGALPPFDWRVSVAAIERDGPFSALPSIDRVFAVIEGAVALAFGDAHGAHARADADMPPLAFAGEAAPHARPLDDVSARALNLMLARGRRAGGMRRVWLADGEPLDDAWCARVAGGAPAVRAIYLQRGAVAVGDDLARDGALALLDIDDPAPRARGGAVLLEMSIGPSTRSGSAPTD